ncbi:hypothetical protein A3Q56_02848 [Intoshia linei]|uniref:Uncharacterized protein n=1 Tax=Intoshia linei TaxID=1819745 RepID=A0A177B523_9BILA|nr:hypothetical protein A3Q56_02848 [Intoshia linei]
MLDAGKIDLNNFLTFEQFVDSKLTTEDIVKFNYLREKVGDLTVAIPILDREIVKAAMKKAESLIAKNDDELIVLYKITLNKMQSVWSIVEEYTCLGLEAHPTKQQISYAIRKIDAIIYKVPFSSISWNEPRTYNARSLMWLNIVTASRTEEHDLSSVFNAMDEWFIKMLRTKSEIPIGPLIVEDDKGKARDRIPPDKIFHRIITNVKKYGETYTLNESPTVSRRQHP